MSPPLNTKIIIDRFVAKWGDLYDYSKVVYINANTKVIIICPTHDEFEQLPNNHVKYGCGKCGNANNSRNKELKEGCARNFKEKASLIHAGKYTYDKSIYIDCQTKSIVTCPDHGDF